MNIKLTSVYFLLLILSVYTVYAVEPLTWIGNVVTYSQTTTSITGNANLQYTNYVGSNFNGTSGSFDRAINISDPGLITIDNYYLHPITDFEINGDYLIIKTRLFDEQKVTIYTDVSLVGNNYLGSSLTGNDGGTNRILESSNPQQVLIDNYLLHPLLDYTENDTHINFSIKVFDTQKITVWS